MKSDHPVQQSRSLIYEAQQAYYFGLPFTLALASVTATPAKALGLSHRIGILQVGADADVVLWDSHPLQLGATPRKVWVDGILQIPVPMKNGQPTPVDIGVGKEGEEWKYPPHVPNWDAERKEVILWDGLPPLEGQETEDVVYFTNVKQLWSRTSDGTVTQLFSAHALEDGTEQFGDVIARNGKVVCVGVECAQEIEAAAEGCVKVVDLRGGVISPGMMTYGSPLGLEEIASEPSTGDGATYDAFTSNIPAILNDPGSLLRAMDGLVFGTRNAL